MPYTQALHGLKNAWRCSLAATACHRWANSLPPNPPPAPTHRHHAEDVLLAFATGLSLALCFYRQAFASPLSRRAGCVSEEAAASGRSSGSTCQVEEGERGVVVGQGGEGV